MGVAASTRGARASSNSLQQQQQEELAAVPYQRPHESAGSSSVRPARSTPPVHKAAPAAAAIMDSAEARATSAEASGAAAVSASSASPCPVDGLMGSEESYEALRECFLLIYFFSDQATASARAAWHFLQASATGSGTSHSADSALREAGEKAYGSLSEARRQQLWVQHFREKTPEARRQSLQIKADWEDLAECFFRSFYGISRTFWLPQNGLAKAARSVASCDYRRSTNNSSSNDRSGSSSNSSSSTGIHVSTNNDAVAAVPVDLPALREFYRDVVSAARAVETNGAWDPLGILLEAIERLCGKLLEVASALQHPQQLAFVPILLECPFLEEDVEFAALSKLCEVAAALPYNSRCLLVNWYEAIPVSYLPQHISVVQQFLSVRLLTAGPFEAWHYFQLPAHPAETALQASLQLLHVLYVANVRRQQNRLQLKHWRQQQLYLPGETAEEFLDSLGCPFAVADGEQTATKEWQQQQQLREADFAAFHNDAINSNQQLLQHEFAVWLHLRRGAPISRFLQPQNLRHRQPAAGDPTWEGQQQEQQQRTAGSEPTAAASSRVPQTHGDADVSAASAAVAAAAADGGTAAAVPANGAAATAAPAAAAAREGAGTAGVEAASWAAVRSMSVDSLFSAGAEAEAALRSLPDFEAQEGGDAAASAAEETLGREEYDFGLTDDFFPSSLLRLVAAAAAEGPANTPGYRTAAAVFSRGGSTPAAAAAAAPAAIFCHSKIPESSADFPVFSLLAHSFVLNACSKAEILRRQAAIEQQHQARQSEMDVIMAVCTGNIGYSLPFLYLRVRRSHLVQDTLQQIAASSSSGGHSSNSNLRKALKVKFIGEEGVDQGGVAKEFFQLLVDELFSPDYGMFSVDEESHMHWFCGYSLEGRYRFELIGILCGLAIHNSVLMPVQFPLVLFKKLLGWPADSLEDLYFLHPQVARSLRCVLEASPEALEAMGLTFSVFSDFFGEQREEALGMHDPNDKVTPANREEYVQLYIEHVLDVSVRDQYSAFEEGFHRCVDKSTISLFLPEELQLLLLGKEEELDVSLLQKATTYQDGYTKDSPAIEMFWNVCKKLTDSEKRKLLMFITGSDRVPLGGLRALQLTIGRSGPDTDRLPTAHTCFNFLLLPDYSSEEKMSRLLLVAIQNCQGFGLR